MKNGSQDRPHEQAAGNGKDGQTQQENTIRQRLDPVHPFQVSRA